MNSGSLSGRQWTNHNTRYTILIISRQASKTNPEKFQSHLYAREHIHIHMATCTPPIHTSKAVWITSTPLSIGSSPYMHLPPMGDADASALHGAVLLPAALMHVTVRNPC